MDPSGLQYPPPTDHQAFERVTRRVFARQLSLPQLNGRTGQKQSGCDIVVRADDGRYVVIQCKLKDELADDLNLRKQDFRAEVLAARDRFKPAPGRFILVTTAANDAKLQEYARLLTEELSADDIEVLFCGWHDMRALIGEDVELREDYLGVAGISALSNMIDGNHQEVMGALVSLLGRVPPAADSTSPQLKRALDRVRARIEKGQVRPALTDLLALREDEWETASDDNRFAILTQTGSAHWQLGERELATPLFVEASALLPDNKTGLANLAASLAVSGDAAGARDAALRLLELDPDTEIGLLALVQAQELLDPLPDPLDVVPAPRRDCEEALLGAIQVLRNREDERWVALAEEGIARHPGSELLQKVRADSVLQRLAGNDGAHIGARLSAAPAWDEIAAAADTLRNQWREHVALDPTEFDITLALNLAQLLRALDRIDEAIEVAERAGLDRSPDGSLTTIRAILLASAGRAAEARVRLAERLDVLANIVLAANLAEDPAEVRALLAEGDWRDATDDQLMWRAVLDSEARARLDPGYDPSEELAALSAAHPTRAVPLVALGRRASDVSAIDECASAIIDRIGPDMPFSDVLQAAEWLRRADRPKHIVALLGGRVATDVDNPGLNWLIQALIALDERAALVSLLNQVAEPLASTERFLHYRALAFFNSGDMAGAREAVSRLLELVPGNLHARMMWVEVLIRQDDRQLIADWLEGPVEQLEGSVGERANLGHLLASFGHFERAQRHGYRVARANPDDKHAQERFLAICLLHPIAAATPVVAPRTVFTLVDAAGVRQTFRLEAEEGLPREVMDLGPNAPIARLALGRKEGEEIRLPAQLGGAPDQVFRIDAILHTQVHYFRALADTMPTRFEGPVMMHKFMSGRRPAIKGVVGSSTVSGAVMSSACCRGCNPLALMFVRLVCWPLSP